MTFGCLGARTKRRMVILIHTLQIFLRFLWEFDNNFKMVNRYDFFLELWAIQDGYTFIFLQVPIIHLSQGKLLDFWNRDAHVLM